MTQYAKICVPVPLKTEFIYCFDSEKLQVIPGVRVMVPFGSRRTRGYVIGLEDSAPDSGFSVREIIRVIDKEPVFSKKDYELALWMEKFYFSSRGEILDTMIPGGRRDVGFGAVSFDGDAGGGDFELSDDQKNAVNIVTESDKGLFYLYGVTGSGKTEVFLRCAKDVIDHGGQVIYLVPEITLTHQLARQVLNRFENNVAILHSGLTDAQRITQWRRIKRGEVGLVIGARSAVFAPCDRLKMIIIDEEHENSYKSGNSPRYHARQVAQKRISDCGGKLLLGSATPSLEAWAMMKDPSRMIRLDLRQRVGGGAMPEVTVADMSGEKGIFSALLQKKMTDALGAGRQVILFLNRRGYSYYFHCRNCGFELKCPHCDVTMTYHRKSGELICHYCGSRRKPLKVCPECHSTDVMYSGFGTEQVENELMKLFPSVPVARLDTDTVSSDRKLIDRTLEDFRTGKTKILLGTQMVAKGLNFPNVSLVGIILADSGLLIPDFRAEERTFDLLVQVSGRSGRADSSGEVVIQTRMKNSPAITYACNAKTGEFFDRELEIRRQTGFPPFSRLINIVIRSRKQEAAYTTSCNLAEKLRERHGDFEVFGAQECPI
ncbi:MAG: primosomal protein N', partial [Sphaerochaetaceae bacterium]|nr:primosomal protein N' [Sphaerochaetaceae bacterium]